MCWPVTLPGPINHYIATEFNILVRKYLLASWVNRALSHSSANTLLTAGILIIC